MKTLIVNKSKLLIILCFSLFHFFGMAQTFQVPEKPSFIPPIIDSTKTLSETLLGTQSNFDLAENCFQFFGYDVTKS